MKRSDPVKYATLQRLERSTRMVDLAPSPNDEDTDSTNTDSA